MPRQIWSNLETTLVCVCVLQTYHSVQDVLVSFGRRTLCYPLYRHFSLITRAVKDVACIFQSGEFCPSFFISQLNPDLLAIPKPPKDRVEGQD